jgi:hypothetical protein
MNRARLRLVDDGIPLVSPAVTEFSPGLFPNGVMAMLR